MAAGAGLSWAIANPSHELLMNTKAAADVLTARDKDSLRYIKKFSAESEAAKAVSKEKNAVQPEDEMSLEEIISKVIIEGRREDIEGYCRKALDAGYKPAKLLQEDMIPAIMKVGGIL